MVKPQNGFPHPDGGTSWKGQPRHRLSIIASTAILGFTLRSIASRQASTASSRRSVLSGVHFYAAAPDSSAASVCTTSTGARRVVTSTSR